jgi:hypothetical protein
MKQEKIHPVHAWAQKARNKKYEAFWALAGLTPDSD